MASKRAEQLQAQGERTRVRLLDVARSVLADDSAASLNAIAKVAGVGIGTLYRHFPAREDLVFELYRHEVHALAAAADQLLATSGAPAALRSWLDRYADFVMAKAGLVDALRPAASHGRFSSEAYLPVTEAIGRLLKAGVEAGTLRAGYAADDILLATDGLYRLAPGSDWQPRAARLFELIMTGLRPAS